MRLITYARMIVKEAEAIRDVLSEKERGSLPVSDPPKSWWPGNCPEELTVDLNQAVNNLYRMTKAIRDEGFQRIVVKRDIEWPVGTYVIQELQEAIGRVKRFLECA